MVIAMGCHKPDNIAGSSASAIMVGLFVASGGFLFGYDTGAMNGILAMREFKNQFGTTCTGREGNNDICTSGSSLVVAILSAGAAVGALLGAPVGDSLGRRVALMISAGIFCIGSIIQACAQDILMLVVGRALAGVGVGGVSLLVPLYQSEMAPKWVRGTLVCAYQLSITVGLLAASIVNVVTAEVSDSAAYRVPLSLQIVPALILTAGLLILPETPRFLVMKGRHEAAGLSLSRLRRLDITHPALVDELQEVVANHQYELSLGSNSYKDMFLGSPHLCRRTFTGCGLQMLQQLSGINFIMYYGTIFFDSAGVGDPYIKSVIINIINVISTFPGLLVIESWGRRNLLMIGATGMAACQLLIALSTTANDSDSQATGQTILIVFCAINICFFAMSWGPVVWVITSEIFPLKIRAKAMSVSTASNWLLNFGIGYSTPFLVSEGPGNASFGARIFFIWGAFCIVGILFVWCMVYETSKISLEQVDEMYERVDHAWNSKKFEPSWSFQQILDENWSPSGQPPSNQGLQMDSSQSSTNTTLGDVSSITAHGNNSNDQTNASSNENKAIPMANVQFSY